MKIGNLFSNKEKISKISKIKNRIQNKMLQDKEKFMMPL